MQQLNQEHSNSSKIRSTTESYNGSSIYNRKTGQLMYSWSQSLDEIDLTVPVQSDLKSKDQCKVLIESKRLSVRFLESSEQSTEKTNLKQEEKSKEENSQDLKPNELKKVEHWTTRFDHQLAHSIRKSTAYWTLEPGCCLRIFLEKEQQRWWNRFLSNESKLDFDKLEKTVPYDQLSNEEQNVIQQLAYQQIDKLTK